MLMIVRFPDIVVFATVVMNENRITEMNMLELIRISVLKEREINVEKLLRRHDSKL